MPTPTFRVDFQGGQIKETQTNAAPVVVDRFSNISDFVAAAKQRGADVIPLPPGATDIPISPGGIVVTAALAIDGDGLFRLRMNGNGYISYNSTLVMFGSASGIFAANPSLTDTVNLTVYAAA
jgi:hypothetical protein